MTKKNEFKVGDKVTLKSDSPVMTVNEVLHSSYDNSITIRCQWFAGAKLQGGAFDPETLVHAKDEATD